MFFGYFKSDPFGSDSGNGGGRIEPPATQRKEEMNFFAKETVIDPALTSALQAPVKVPCIFLQSQRLISTYLR